MRKFLFFAIALVAGALAFTSCDPNNPQDPGDVKLVGTMWRVDSCLMPTPVYDMGQESRYVSQPYVIIKVPEDTIIKAIESLTDMFENDTVGEIKKIDAEKRIVDRIRTKENDE